LPQRIFLEKTGKGLSRLIISKSPLLFQEQKAFNQKRKPVFFHEKAAKPPISDITKSEADNEMRR